MLGSMETVTQGAEELGRTLGRSYEGGATSALDLLLSPMGILALFAAFLVFLWILRR